MEKKKAVPKTSTKKVTVKTQVPDKQKKNKTKKTGEKKGKGVGRKPWIPDYGKIENWATQGLWDKEIAALSGVCHQVFCEKKNELPELVTALELGRAKGVAACSQKLLSLALGGSERSLHFYLERIGGRKNVTVIETPPKPVHEMSEEELLAIINGTPLG